MNEVRYWQGLGREQKMAAFFLFIFALITMVLGTLQLRHGIYSPFAIHVDNKPADKQIFSDELARLKRLDTDHDGLSDYDELYVYHTSPYLWSTASDDTSDLEKVERGLDPLCPMGKNCAEATALDTTASTSIASPLFDKSSGSSAIDLLGAAAQQAQMPTDSQLNAPSSASSTIDMQALAHDPAALRKLLLQTGKISAADLQKIDDAALLSLSQQIMATRVGGSGRSSAGANSNTK